MADPTTIGMLVARALRLGAEVRVKRPVGEAVNNAYVALKSKLSAWATDDIRALEERPDSQAQERIIVEIVDSLSPLHRDSLYDLAQTLANELEKSALVAVLKDPEEFVRWRA